VSCSATDNDDNDDYDDDGDHHHHLSFMQNRCNSGSTRIEPHSLNTTCRIHFLLKNITTKMYRTTILSVIFIGTKLGLSQ